MVFFRIGLFLIGVFSSASAVYSVNHPLILATASEKNTILARANQSTLINSAYQRLSDSVIARKGEDEGWSYDLIQKSFYAWLSGDTSVRNDALNLFRKYSQGDIVYGFDRFSEDRLKAVYWPGCSALAIGYDNLYSSLDDPDKVAARKVLSGWGSGLYDYYKTGWHGAGNNFGMGPIACLGLIGLVLEGEASNSQLWVDSAKNALTTYAFNGGYNPAGDYTEGHVYQNYGTPPAIIFASAYEKRYRVSLTANTAVANLWDYGVYALMSEGKYPAYGDNNNKTIVNGENFYLLAKRKLSDVNRARVWLWLWYQIRPNGVNQTDWSVWKQFDYIGILLWYPVELTQLHPDQAGLSKVKIFPSHTASSVNNVGGMVNLRTGWEGENLTFWLTNRYRWQNHQHYDPNHFVLSAYGQKLIGNENLRSYSDPLRGKLSQQNGMMVDPDSNTGDMPDGSYVTGVASSLGRLNETFSSSDVSLISSDARYPMADFSTQEGLTRDNGSSDGYTAYWEATEYNVTPVNQAERTVLLVNKMFELPYIIMLDEINKDGSDHVYSWQSYLGKGYMGLSGQGTLDQPLMFQVGSSGARIIATSDISFTKRITAGDGISRLDDRLQLLFNPSAKLRLVTYIIPEKPGDKASWQVTAQGSGMNWWATMVKHGVSENLVIYNDTGSSINVNGVDFKGKLAVVAGSGGLWNKYAVFRTHSLAVDGKYVVNSNTPITGDGTIPLPTQVPTLTFTATPGVCPSGSLGNLNCDLGGAINGVDWAIMRNKWTTTGQVVSPSPGHYTSDIVQDGKVDASDLAKLLTNWTI